MRAFTFKWLVSPSPRPLPLCATLARCERFDCRPMCPALSPCATMTELTSPLDDGLANRSPCRPHDAEEVYVTGTFDNWTKSERLERVGQVFQKTVTLPDDSDKIYYKVSDAFRFVSPLEFLVRVRVCLVRPMDGRAREPGGVSGAHYRRNHSIGGHRASGGQRRGMEQNGSPKPRRRPVCLRPSKTGEAAGTRRQDGRALLPFTARGRPQQVPSCERREQSWR